MELRHLRYFVAVAEVLNFTKAAAQIRVAQPALSRRVQDLEDEIGVDLLRRGPRGVTLTAEGKLFLDEARKLLKNADEAVAKVRALARGEYGELHVGYAPSPSVEILPPSLAAFQKAVPCVRVILHDLAGDEIIARLLDGTLELAVTVENPDQCAPGVAFEELRRYQFCVAMASGHPLARKKSVSVEEVAAQPLIGFCRSDYTVYYRSLDRMFASVKARPRIDVECDGATSMLTELEAGSHIAVVGEMFHHVWGKRLVYRPLSNSTETHSIGIARATKGDVTPAGEKFCKILRKISIGTTGTKPKLREW